MVAVEQSREIFARIGRLRRLGARGARLLFPPECIACGTDIPDPRTLCQACWAELHLISGAVCDGCARPVPLASAWEEGALHCDDCKDAEFAWTTARAAAFYEGTARKLVLALKHGDRLDLAPSLALWMARAGAGALDTADLIVPVPLHWTRRSKRRMNQAAELSRLIARRTGIRHGAGVLRRVKPTKSLGHLHSPTRRAILEDAFAAPAPLAGRRIALIDDVMTSGATLSEAARVLREAGAETVSVIVFARAARPLSETGVSA